MTRKFSYPSLIHNNGNLMCAVDVETTGTDWRQHDIWQICVLPLDSQLKPYTQIMPFYTELQPRRPETAEANAIKRDQLAKACLKGLDYFVAADLFDEWFQKLNLPFNKRIMVLAQNWVFDRSFLIDWLGLKAFDLYFDARYRDTMSTALYLNDWADFHAEQVPYPKVNLRYLASQLRIEYTNPHDAMEDCRVTAEVYRQMILHHR